MSSAVEVAVLGTTAVRSAGVAVNLGSPKQRALLAALALTPGQPVSVDALVDLLWGNSAPAGVTGTLQAYVSGLRRVLEPERERRAPASVLVTVPPGYALQVRAHDVDASRFEATVSAEHRRLSTPVVGAPALDAAELTAAVRRLDDALALWHGEPFVDLGDASAVVAHRAHLEELRLIALENRAAARLSLGDHQTTAADLAVLTTAHPLRERLWALRALALFRSGRQAEALDVLGQVRAVLADELGLDLGRELQDLQELVLRQDPTLSWVAPRQAVPPPADRPGPGAGPAAGSPPIAPPAPVPLDAAGASPAAPPGAVAPARNARPVGATSGAPVVPPWPLLGRDAELGRLREELAAAQEGRAAFAVITGEPGIGKSRLGVELCAAAELEGARVHVGRCSQDEGAPPLWPWATILRQLGEQLPEVPESDGGNFRLWEAVTHALRTAAGSGPGPLVLVLDDLHWADTATLRVLRLLVETAGTEPLLVLATWRSSPPPTGALADAAEALARRHATRVELAGLDPGAVAGVVSAVTRQRPSDQQVAALRRRTDGNPFFLVEYALLADSGTDLEQLLAEDHPPTAVQEVLTRRLDRLPDATIAALRAAAVIGRQFGVTTLAAVTSIDEDDVLDVIEPAQATGLVREAAVDRFEFAHALVRDTLYSGLTPSRRARQHARVAHHLEQLPGHETELARHLLAAGPAHAARAWRAATSAAEVAMRAHAYQEAVDLLRSALDALADDGSATPRDRYDVLVGLAAAYRRAVAWPELVATVEQAVAAAESIDDPIRAAEAATMTAQGALWISAAHGQVHHGLVAALRRSLDRLPPGDSPLRCRCLANLAGELYYATGFPERRALVDEALAMARRLADPRLTLDVCLIGYLAVWAPHTADERFALADEARQLAEELDEGSLTVVAGTLQAVAASELGRVDLLWSLYEATRARAESLREAYSLLVLDSMMLAWHALAGRFDECDRLLGSVLTLAGQASLNHVDDALRGNFLAIMQWRGDLAVTEEAVADLTGTAFPMTATIGMLLWRAGREDDARAYVTHHDVDLEPRDWFSMMNWCYAGAMAAVVPDARLGAEVYAILAPYAGRGCAAGSGVSSGPVDGYLALAAFGAGETDVATRHADDAERLAEAWRIPLFARWFREQRDRFGF